MTTAIKTSTADGFKDKESTAHHWAKQTLGFIATVLVSLIALEAIFYCARAGESDHLMPDSYVGFKPIPNKRITYRQEGYSSVTYNSFGMQNDEITEKKSVGTYRVAVFGDSCVESLQVPREDNYCGVLAKHLQVKLQKPVEVLNFGVGNYSIAQDFIRYKTLASRFSPDLVILAYRVRETDKMLPDPTMNMVCIRPVFFNIDGHMKYDDAMIKQFARTKEYKRLTTSHWLRCYSRIWGVLGQMNKSWAVFCKRNDFTLKLPFETAQQKPEPPSAVAAEASHNAFLTCYWPMANGLLQLFAFSVKQHGSQFVIMRTPQSLTRDLPILQCKLETNLLRKTAANINARFIDVDSEYRADGLENQCKEYFLEQGHFSKTMHHRIGKRLSQLISEELVQQ